MPTIFGVITFALGLRAWISDGSKISSSSMSATKVSPFQIRPLTMHIQGMFQVKLSYQIDGTLTALLQK